MKENILALLYSVEQMNIELAEQLIIGLAESEDKTALTLVYTQLKAAAAHFELSISEMLLGLGGARSLELKLQDCVTLPNWLAALSGRLQAASIHLSKENLLSSFEDIAYFKGLKHLELTTTSPTNSEFFFELASLEMLSCYYKEKGRLSERLGRLKRLVFLCLNSKKSIELPNNFINLSTLKVFDCQYPIKVEALRTQVLRLPSLLILSVEASGLTELPIEIKDTNLSMLLMNGYPLADLPPLPLSLKELQITQAQAMSAIPAAIFALPNLEVLQLMGLCISNLTEDILTLPKSMREIYIEASLLTNTKANYWHERLHRQYPEADIYIEGN